MELFLLISIGIAAASAVGLAIVAWHFVFPPMPGQPEPFADILELSAGCYLPMSRILDDRDFPFLRLQPNFTPRMAAGVRTQRYRLFVAYLDRLRVDFERIAWAIQNMLAHADHDRPELSAALVCAR